MTTRVLCVGAGPAGLYTAFWLKRLRPEWSLCVMDSRAEDRAYGFGVVFSRPTIEAMRERDPELVDFLRDAGASWGDIEIRLGRDSFRCMGQGFYAVGRAALLRFLGDRARSVGVDLRFGARIADATDLPEHDFLVGADGSRSRIRSLYAEEFQPEVALGQSRFVWFGTSKPYDALTFFFRKNAHGAFGVHAYPYAPGASTFLVEADEATWRATDLHHTDPVEQEQASLRYCRDLFSDELAGHELVGNRSLWQRFRMVSTKHWTGDRKVLIGDAAHTAHFSTGSGTKAALEDAILLADSLAGARDVNDGCAAYEHARRASVERLLAGANPSREWWESFTRGLEWPIEAFVGHFLTRNLRINLASIRRRDPETLNRISRAFAARSGASPDTEPERCPLDRGALHFPSRRMEHAAAPTPIDGGVGLLVGPPCTRRELGPICGFRVSTAAELASPDLDADWIQIPLAVARGLNLAELRRRHPACKVWCIELAPSDVVAKPSDAGELIRGYDACHIAAGPQPVDSARAGDIARNTWKKLTSIDVSTLEDGQTALLGERADLFHLVGGNA